MTEITPNIIWESGRGRSNNTSLALQLVETNSHLKSRNIIVLGHRTSVRLEPAMWEALKDISRWERKSINEIVSAIADCQTRSGSLTSAIRIFVMGYFRARSQMSEAA